MKQINNIMVSDDMSNIIRRAASGGAKQFLAIPDSREIGACENCNGAGQIDYSMVVGGPSDIPMPCTPKHNESNTYKDGKWYKIRSKAFDCPVCQGR